MPAAHPTRKERMIFNRQTSSVMDESDPRLVTGTPEDRARARAELIHNKRVERAMRSGLPELERADLTFERFGIVRHTNGDLYHVRRGEIDDPAHSGAIAFYFAGDGGVPVYLEQPTTGPRSVEEREEMRLERERVRERREAEAAGRRRVWARAAS